jgi:hypothetical protein
MGSLKWGFQICHHPETATIFLVKAVIRDCRRVRRDGFITHPIARRTRDEYGSPLLPFSCLEISRQSNAAELSDHWRQSAVTRER